MGEHVEIKTRFQKESTFEIDITPEWLESPDWELAAYEIPNIPAGTTRVEMSHLRKAFSDHDVEELRTHLSETYAWFLHAGCTITVNSTSLRPLDFDRWAYPPGFPPHKGAFDITLDDRTIGVDITAGLILDRDPEQENYGVYVYCNHRLIVKGLKTRDVGYFVSTEAGVPHPDASLCRAIVQLQGPAKLMPWNSSKSGINVGHAAFQQLRPTLIRLVSHFSSLSRRLKTDWDEKVFPYTAGTIERIDPEEATTGKRLNLPPLPRVNKPQIEQLKARNKANLRDKPWTLGLLEAMAAVDVVTRQRLETKNRIALILLDSNFEIGIKEFLVHRDDLFPPSQFDNATIQRLFKKRADVIAEVTKKVNIPKKLLDRAQHYYSLRNKLIHERATVDITNADVYNYRSTIQEVLSILFKLKFTKA